MAFRSKANIKRSKRLPVPKPWKHLFTNLTRDFILIYRTYIYKYLQKHPTSHGSSMSAIPLRKFHITFHIWKFHIWNVCVELERFHIWNFHIWNVHIWNFHIWNVHIWEFHIWSGCVELEHFHIWNFHVWNESSHMKLSYLKR